MCDDQSRVIQCPLSGAVNGHQKGIISTAKMSLPRNVNNSLGPQWPRNVKLGSSCWYPAPDLCNGDIPLIVPGAHDVCHESPGAWQSHNADNVTMSQRCAIPGCLIQHRWYRLVTLVPVWPCVAPGSLCHVITPSLAPFKHLTPCQCVTPAVTGTIGINTEIWDAGGVFTQISSPPRGHGDDGT